MRNALKSPVLWSAIAVAVIIFGVHFLVTPGAFGNHLHWARAHQGNDLVKMWGATGDVVAKDKECDGHPVEAEVSYIDDDGDRQVAHVKDRNGCKKGGGERNLGAYNINGGRVVETNDDDCSIFGCTKYVGRYVSIDYSDD